MIDRDFSLEDLMDTENSDTDYEGNTFEAEDGPTIGPTGWKELGPNGYTVNETGTPSEAQQSAGTEADMLEHKNKNRKLVRMIKVL